MSSNIDDVEYTITHNSDENKLETYTTWPLWIMAQKMQEAERIFNHHVYNVGAIRCIHDDSKSSYFLYLLSHNEFEYYHDHNMYCTENARS